MRKKENKEEKILAAMDAIDKSVRTLEKFAAMYDSKIDRAALLKQDKMVKYWINSKVYLLKLAENLRTAKSNLELGSFSSQALSSLSTLPAAISGCKGIMSQVPDFKKLGKDMGKLFQEIQVPTNELEKLNKVLADTMDPPAEFNASRLDGIGEEQAVESEAYQAEYAAMMERVKSKVAQEPVVKPSAPAQTNPTNPMTGNFDLASIIQDENRR